MDFILQKIDSLRHGTRPQGPRGHRKGGMHARSDRHYGLKFMDALKASIAADRATYSEKIADKIGRAAAGFLLALVDVIRGLVRPAIPLYFVYFIAKLWADVKVDILAKMQTVGETMGAMLTVRVVDAALFLALTVVGWWFGTRPPKSVDEKV